MSSVSPLPLRTMVGTAESGARSETDDWAREAKLVGGPRWTPGGEDESMPVLEVGRGVGYFE